MKTVKGLLLGSAAAFVAMSGAQAADLPMAAPVQYVKVCDTYGAGFFYIPGTQTCLQISGFAKGQFRYDQPFTRIGNAISFRAQAGVNFDVRTQSPWGTVRAYVGIGTYFQSNNTSINQFFWGTPLTSAGYIGANAAVPNIVYITNAYVQFAGLTAGYTMSNFDFPIAFPEVQNTPISNLLPVLQVAYTASFGNGFSATIGVEDGRYRRPGDFTPSGNAGISVLNQGAQEMPDIVGNLRVIQGWGAAQLSAAIHQVRAGGATANPTGAFGGAVGSWDTTYGFAVQGAVRINLPMLAPGDDIVLTGTYADGAMGYIGFGPTNSGGFFGADYTDAFVTPGGKLSTMSGWQVMASLKHYWTPNLRSNFTIAYDTDTVPGFVKAAAVPAGQTTSYITSAVNIIWSPIPNLDLGLEAYNQTGFRTAVQKAAGLPDSKWTFISWIQRNF
ncbi:MAG TPA: porin [Hyphomicrobiales bacterium]|nr:porin [Hyphomicrobiales bacterium]